MVKVSFKDMVLRLALSGFLNKKFGLFAALLGSWVLAGCTWSAPRRPSVLIIAVEGLSFDAFSCTSESLQINEDFKGFKTFCDEAVKFTHAYTPSVLSQPVLASILTGLYPEEHGLRHHGKSYLKSSFTTLPELALQKGYHTLFISGGAPAWRKTGLSQGFELFEDNIRVSQEQLYRPIANSIQIFFNSISEEKAGRPFFSVIFSNDLQFPEQMTQNQTGEIRSQSVQSQLFEVGESLEILSRGLKKMGRWDDTHVVLVGLNGGYFNPRPEEERSVSLYSSNTQVKLFIKPATKRRDLALQWSIDPSVTLVDLGPTLAQLINVELPQKSRHAVVSLGSVLRSPEVDWSEGRILMSESAWSQWYEMGVVRTSLRMDQYLYIFDQKPQLYNTLIDRLEVAKILESDPLVKKPITLFREHIEKNQILPWRPLPDSLMEKMALGRTLWKTQLQSENVNQRLVQLTRRRNWDEQLWSWRAQRLIQEKNWPELLVIAAEAGRKDWEYLAHQHLGHIKKLWALNSCQKILLNFSDEMALRECRDPLLESLIDWVKASSPEAAQSYKEIFLRMYDYHQIDQSVAKMNYINGLVWSTDPKNPVGLSTTEVALLLPRMEGFLRQVLARRAAKNL